MCMLGCVHVLTYNLYNIVQGFDIHDEQWETMVHVCDSLQSSYYVPLDYNEGNGLFQ